MIALKRSNVSLTISSFYIAAVLTAGSTLSFFAQAADNESSSDRAEPARRPQEAIFFETPIQLEPGESALAFSDQHLVDLHPRPQLFFETLFDPAAAWYPDPDREVEDQDMDVLERQVEERHVHEQRLRQLEQANGVWEPSVAEQLMSLGAVLQQQGEHQDALDIFERAIQINRINFGLDSLQQITPVEQLINSHLALDQWEEADAQQDYVFYIYTRAYRYDDPALIPVLIDYARWQMTAYYRGIGEAPVFRVLNAYQLYSAAYRLATHHYTIEHPRLPALLNDLAGAAYLAARNQTELQAEISRGRQGITSVAADRRVTAGVTNSRNAGFRQGELALQGLIALHEERLNNYSDKHDTEELESLALKRIEAISRLGDWYLLFGRYQTAAQTYEQAWEEAAAFSEERRAGVFDAVTFLPDFSTFIDSRQVAATAALDREPELGYVDISFDVNRFGRISNVQVIDAYPAGNRRIEAQLRRAVADRNVRPRLDNNGEMASMEGAVFRFPYWY